MIHYYQQETNYTCGACAMRMILEACKIQRSEKQVAAMLKTNKVRGTWSHAYPRVAEKFHLDYIVQENACIADLRNALRDGYHCLLAFYVPKEKVDHFTVVKKIDKTYIYFYDPWYGNDHRYTLSYFLKVWKVDPRYEKKLRWFIGVRNN